MRQKADMLGDAYVRSSGVILPLIKCLSQAFLTRRDHLYVTQKSRKIIRTLDKASIVT